MRSEGVQLTNAWATIDLPDGWQRAKLPSSVGAWLAAEPMFGFIPNAVLTESRVGAQSPELFVQDTLAGIGTLPDAFLIDLSLPEPEDLRIATSYLNVDGCRLTLLQRVIVRDQWAFCLSVSVPDLAMRQLEELWRPLLRSFTVEVNK